MGFLNKKPIIKAEGFHPIDLNEGNVQAIFERCLATKESTETNGIILFRKSKGYSEDSTPVIFDMIKIKENKQTIEFLYGQLQMMHEYDSHLTPQKAQKKYDGTLWTQDGSISMQFLCLGNIINAFPSFLAQINSTVLLLNESTISPKDPAFPAWWEAHRAEWETQ